MLCNQYEHDDGYVVHVKVYDVVHNDVYDVYDDVQQCMYDDRCCVFGNAYHCVYAIGYDDIQDISLCVWRYSRYCVFEVEQRCVYAIRYDDVRADVNDLYDDAEQCMYDDVRDDVYDLYDDEEQCVYDDRYACITMNNIWCAILGMLMVMCMTQYIAMIVCRCMAMRV